MLDYGERFVLNDREFFEGGADNIAWIDWTGHNVAPKIFKAGATFALAGDFERAEACFLLTLSRTFAEYPMWHASNDYIEAMAAGKDAVMQLANRLAEATRLALRVDQMEPFLIA